mgnify:CR=1
MEERSGCGEGVFVGGEDEEREGEGGERRGEFDILF